jgi:hypothetical protein
MTKKRRHVTTKTKNTAKGVKKTNAAKIKLRNQVHYQKNAEKIKVRCKLHSQNFKTKYHSEGS